MPLRDYQNELVEAVRNSYKTGHRLPCIVLPCGGGKSIIAAEISRRTTAKNNRVLFLVHRKELCDQIRGTFNSYGVNMRLCDIMMVQTAARRINKIIPPKLVITDENHHCLAGSYKKIYNAFPDAKFLGITATPVRLNGDGLGDVNDDLIEGVSARWLIDNNYLADYDYYAPEVADLTGLRVKRTGDYDPAEIEKCLAKNTIYGDVISYYRKFADGRQAICYCASVNHSKQMAAAFSAAGIEAVHIDGDTPKIEREKIIENFRRGAIDILCNVDLISEGFDVPDCSAAILLRPTKSLTLYIQQSMRCMRYKPEKRAVIIDHVMNYARFGMPDAERKWTLEKKDRKTRENTAEKDVEVRQCPKCFGVFPPANVCPYCGYVFETQERKLHEEQAELKKIQGFKLDFSTPDECKNYSELLNYAKNHGYKPGWAYYRAKEQGYL